jgi:predicted HD superfamily hydrolase involved in NAD metabolism
VASTAAELAAAYGVDTERARVAGVLHDWHRETSAEELVARSLDAGLEVTEVDATVPYLLHGPLAALELADVFPDVGADVLHAISTHTYGGDSLTPLDMVVYIADVIEPERDHHGVADLRAAVGAVPLTELFARTYQISLRHLVDRRRRIHRATVSTWNRFVVGEHR